MVRFKIICLNQFVLCSAFSITRPHATCRINYVHHPALYAASLRLPEFTWLISLYMIILPSSIEELICPSFFSLRTVVCTHILSIYLACSQHITTFSFSSNYLALCRSSFQKSLPYRFIGCSPGAVTPTSKQSRSLHIGVSFNAQPTAQQTIINCNLMLLFKIYRTYLSQFSSRSPAAISGNFFQNPHHEHTLVLKLITWHIHILSAFQCRCDNSKTNNVAPPNPFTTYSV